MVLHSESAASAIGCPARTTTPARTARWGRRVTAAAFWFFLVKGLAWLAVPALAAYYANG